MELRKLYDGLDGLDITFQGCMSLHFLSVLKRAKEAAQQSGRPETVTYKGFTFDVPKSGAVGYSYQVNTGPDGEIWFFAQSTKRDAWNIRVSVRSMSLALYGYKAVKERIWDRLELFGGWILDHSVARVDYAVDFAAPDFQIKPECVVAHWRMVQSEYVETEETGGFHVVRQGRQINSLTIGKMPGRQVIIYDKRREVIDRRKSYWWKIWGVEKATRVWRVEVRAGKRELKDRWNVSTLESMEAMLPEILEKILTDIRLHADAQTDQNVTRQALHPIWEAIKQAALTPFGSDLVAPDPVPIIEATQEEMKDRYLGLVSGLAASLSVITGVDGDELPEAIGESLTASIAAHIKINKTKFKESKKRARGRLRFLVDATAWAVPTNS
ncbi:MAG: hypothetical protein JKY94_01980 [Rhodobacteraceae bacterium]|nr:hypothetical protein [Paracoccaceae bacterium]